MQGCFYYYNLLIGWHLNCIQCTSLHKPQEVIIRLHDIAGRPKTLIDTMFTYIESSSKGDTYDATSINNVANRDKDTINTEDVNNKHDNSNKNDWWQMLRIVNIKV